MKVYEYNSSTINEYSESGCGTLSSRPDDIVDFGTLSHSNDLELIEDFYYINCSKTIFPFGKLQITSTETKVKKVSSVYRKVYNLNHNSIIFFGIIIKWIGFNFIFESNSSLKRQVIPDVSGGGPSK
jgi:hypothetical protein